MSQFDHFDCAFREGEPPVPVALPRSKRWYMDRRRPIYDACSGLVFIALGLAIEAVGFPMIVNWFYVGSVGPLVWGVSGAIDPRIYWAYGCEFEEFTPRTKSAARLVRIVAVGLGLALFALQLWPAFARLFNGG
jgi:hypothetical protein